MKQPMTPVSPEVAAGIAGRIQLLRGVRVMLDSDLAQLYGSTTKALNQAVKRNAHRFPPDFMFKLTPNEKAEVVTNCDHLRNLRFSRTRPNAFTEHGAIMLASILNTRRAVDVSVHVVRAFVRLREVLASHKELVRRLNEMEQKYDSQFKAVFDALRQLMTPTPEPPRQRIGFHATEPK